MKCVTVWRGSVQNVVLSVDTKQCLAEFELVLTSKIAKVETHVPKFFIFYRCHHDYIGFYLFFFSMANKSLCAILRIERQSGNQNGTKKIMILPVVSSFRSDLRPKLSLQRYGCAVTKAINATLCKTDVYGLHATF